MVFVRKLYSELLQQLLLVFLILTLIISITQMMHFLKMLTDGKITLVALYKLLALTIAHLLGFLLPPCLLLAVLLTLARYYIDNEMTILQSSGVSQAKIYALVMLFAVAVAAFLFVLTCFIYPNHESARKDGMQFALKQMVVQKIKPSTFTPLADSAVIYAQKGSLSKASLYRVHLFKQSTHSDAKADSTKPRIEWTVLYAKSMHQLLVDGVNNAAPSIMFNHGALDKVSLTDGSWSHTDFSRLRYILPGVNFITNVWPDNLNITALVQAASTNKAAAGLLLRKVSSVISVLVLAFWGCLFGYVRPRQGKLNMLFPALIAYGMYTYFVLYLCQKVTAGTWLPWPSFVIFHIAIILVTLVFVCIRYWQAIISRLTYRQTT